MALRAAGERLERSLYPCQPGWPDTHCLCTHGPHPPPPPGSCRALGPPSACLLFPLAACVSLTLKQLFWGVDAVHCCAWQQTPLPSPSEGTLDDGSPAGAETLAPLPRLTQQAQQSHRAHTPGCSRWCLGAIAFCSLAEWQAERAGPAWRPLRLNRAWCPLGRGATMLVESRMAPQRGREDS